MAHKSVINLTQPAVKQEISKVLTTYPDHPHQQAFAVPQMRQQLLSFVLNSMPAEYTVVETEEEEEAPPVEMESFFSGEEVEHLDAVIHQGIHHLLQDQADWVDRHIPQTEDSGRSASHWFG